jgi:hypothetical protein
MQSVAIGHFPDKLRLRVPRGLPAALRIAATQRHKTPAERVRQTLLRGLEAESVLHCEVMGPSCSRCSMSSPTNSDGIVDQR